MPAAFDPKAATFLRVANAAIPLVVRAGYGRIVGVSGQNAFLTGNVTGSVRNAALVIAAKNLADGVAGSGVTINTLSPGTVPAAPAAEVAAASPAPNRSPSSSPRWRERSRASRSRSGTACAG